MRTRRWPRLVAAILFLVLLVLNLYVFFNREWEASYYPSSYATLYYPLDVPTIREWKVVGRDRIQLDIATVADVKNWSVLTDGQNPQSAAGMQPVFKIDTTFSVLHTYRLVPIPEGACQDVEISIRFYSSDFYASLGMQHEDVYIVRANVPCGKFEQYAVADWVDTYAYVGKDGLAEADRVLREDVKIIEGEPTLARMEKLAHFLKGKLANTGGVPKDDERWMNPLLLYKEMVAGTGKGWCTQNAQLWVFWANRAGIPTRFVFVARTQDNTIVYNGHSFAESFVREYNRWVCTDFMDGVIAVFDKRGAPLNAADLFLLNQHDAFDSTAARIYVNKRWADQLSLGTLDTVVTAPYALCSSSIKDELTSHSILKYRRPPNVEDVREIYSGFFKDWTYFTANIDRYFFKPPLAFSLYPTDGRATYFIRQLLLFLLIADLFVWMIFIVLGRRGAPVAPQQEPENTADAHPT
jgi:hypothetical protein